MAKIVDNPQWKNSKYLYPWDEWFDGKTRLLESGEDFSADPSSMYNMIKTAARLRGVEVRARRMGSQIQLQAIV